MMSRTRLAATLTASCMLLLAGHAIAKPASTSPASTSPASTSPGSTSPGGLGGPNVKDTTPPGAGRAFDGGAQGKVAKKDRPVEIPLPIFAKTVKETLASGATKLTDEQSNSLQLLEDDFRAQEQKFRKEHGKEMAELASQLGIQRGRGGPGGPEGPGGPGGPGGKRPGKGKPGDAPAGEIKKDAAPAGDMQAERPKLTDEQREALMTKMRELRDKGPNQTDSKKAMWSLLTAEQQAAVQPKLDEFIKNRTEQYGRKEAEKKAEKKLKEQEKREQDGTAKPRKNPDRKPRPAPADAPAAPTSENK